MSAPSTSSSKIAADKFRLKFSVTEFVKWMLRPLLRKVRGYSPRFYLRSPAYSRRQVVVDRETSQAIPIQIRDTVDISVIKQVFIFEDYRLQALKRHDEIRAWPEKLKLIGKEPLIVDLGANTGLASLYFAREFPTATIIALEPDPGNAAMARQNLESYSKVTVVEGGIASADGRAEILNPGDGNWSYRTELSQTGKVVMFSMRSLMAGRSLPNSSPFIVKIDIEGFESDLFSKNTEWIDLFPILIIELHDWMLPRAATSGNFLREVSRRKRDFVYIGENVFSISNEAWSV
jgi:FkbM family methyltransferase